MKEAVALKGKWRVVALLLLCGLLQGCGLLPPPEGQPEGSTGGMVLQVSVESMPHWRGMGSGVYGARED